MPSEVIVRRPCRITRYTLAATNIKLNGSWPIAYISFASFIHISTTPSRDVCRWNCNFLAIYFLLTIREQNLSTKDVLVYSRVALVSPDGKLPGWCEANSLTAFAAVAFLSSMMSSSKSTSNQHCCPCKKGPWPGEDERPSCWWT